MSFHQLKGNEVLKCYLKYVSRYNRHLLELFLSEKGLELIYMCEFSVNEELTFLLMLCTWFSRKLQPPIVRKRSVLSVFIK